MEDMIFNLHSYVNILMRACTRTCTHGGLGAPIASQHNIIFWLGKTLTHFSCALDAGGFRTSDLWISNSTLYQLSQPITPWKAATEGWLGGSAVRASIWIGRGSASRRIAGCNGFHDPRFESHQERKKNICSESFSESRMLCWLAVGVPNPRVYTHA